MGHRFATVTAEDLQPSVQARDLRPYADRVAGRIVERKAKMLDEQPLVVLMSELHTCPDNRMLPQLVISRLRDHFRIAVGEEMPHNWLWLGLQKEPFSFDIPDEARRCPARLVDPDGSRMLSVLAVTAKHYIMAPGCTLSFSGFLKNHGIKTCFNDAAILPGKILDPIDSLMMSIEGALNNPVRTWRDRARSLLRRPETQEIKMESGSGMIRRNCALVAQTIQHLQRATPDVYILTTGRGHLFGKNHLLGEYKNYAPEWGLGSLFRKAGIRSLNISPFAKDFSSFLTDSVLPDSEPFRDDTLSLDISTPLLDHDNKIDDLSEEGYLHALSTASGGEIELPEDFEAARAEAEAYVRKNAPFWIREAAARTRRGGISAVDLSPIFP